MSNINVGSLSSRISYSNSVSSTDSVDSYSFSLTAPGSLNLALGGLSANADLALLNSSGTVLRSSSSLGTTAEAINIDGLATGTYTARVSSISGDTNYSLSLTADYAGNTLNTARNIGTLKGNISYRNFVGTTDASDFYRLSLSATGSLNVALDGLTADANIQIIQDTNSNGVVDNGDVLGAATNTGVSAESIIVTNLAAGTYFVQAYSVANANTNYRLNLTADYAGNILTSAKNIGTLSDSSISFKDFVGAVDTSDLYSFTFSTPGTFNITLDSLSADANLQIVQDTNNNGLVDSGEVLRSSGNTGTSNESINCWLNAGNYYVQVYPTSGNTNYNLSVSTNNEWLRQVGTSKYESSSSIATDSSGNIYITGYTAGKLGDTNPGSGDAFVAKYNSSGTQLWLKQFGSSNYDDSYAIAIDTSGNVYMTGYTYGDLGGINAGSYDVWLAKYDSNGTQLWLKQFGTASYDDAYSIATDSSGNVYIAGSTAGSLGGTSAGGYDAWLAKYNQQGTQVWLKQFGTASYDGSSGVVTDGSSNVYVTGHTAGNLGGTNAGYSDAFVAKYNTSGTLVWTKQLGTSANDDSNGVAIDSSGNVYLTGTTAGALAGTSSGSSDAFVAKYNSSGTLVWTKQLGTSANDYSYDVAIDSTGSVYFTGSTTGSLAGTNAGYSDGWIVKYDGSGTQLGAKQLGTASYEDFYSIAVAGNGNIYIAGNTAGSLAGTNAGNYDAWLGKFVISNS